MIFHQKIQSLIKDIFSFVSMLFFSWYSIKKIKKKTMQMHGYPWLLKVAWDLKFNAQVIISPN